MVRSKILKDGSMNFYNGNRKATQKEVRTFIKTNYDTLPPEKLSKENRQYLGAVKGGKARAADALTLRDGKFLPASLQKKALHNLGIDIEQLKKDKKLSTIRQVFKDSPELQKSFDKLISTTGLELWYDNEKALSKVETYKGKITINGKEVGNTEAVKMVNDYINKLNRKFDLYRPGVAIKFNYKGADQLTIFLDSETIKTGEDGDNVQLYHSNKSGISSPENKKK